MSSIEELWERIDLTGPGGATRVDDNRRTDLYAATDAEGRVGLLLLGTTEPPPGPPLDAVEVTSNVRHDGRWALGIWLRSPDLRPVFAELCTDLIETSHDVAPEAAPGFLVTRLVRWRQLLERGTGSMGMSQLRGLVGELTVLDRCLTSWPSTDVVAGWFGPAAGPQDFVLPGLRIEVKTGFPTARTVQITSIEQLDTDEPLTLAVVTLTTIVTADGGLAPAVLVDRIRGRVRDSAGEAVVAEFDKRLAATGYELGDSRYERPLFRLEGIRYYEVSDGFPRIRRRSLSPGIDRVTYEVSLGSIAAFGTRLPG